MTNKNSNSNNNNSNTSNNTWKRIQHSVDKNTARIIPPPKKK